jgi:uncharacterized protein YhhL (DUF1145 family)
MKEKCLLESSLLILICVYQLCLLNNRYPLDKNLKYTVQLIVQEKSVQEKMTILLILS